MNARERLLVFAVGGLVAAIGLQYGLGKYRLAIQRRDNQIATLEQQLIQKQERQLLGTEAIVRLSDLQTRSLPSDLELARSDYTTLLTAMGTFAGLSDLAVSFIDQRPHRDLYHQISVKIRGNGDLEELVWMLHAFHSKNYLHRIRSLDVRPTPGKSTLTIDMDVEALALNSAPADLQPLPEPSPAVNPTVEHYTSVILNRNFFAPPNRAPRFAGDSSVEAFVGQQFTYTAEFDDPDGDSVQYALGDDAPEDVQIDPDSGRLQFTPERVGRVQLTVRATDQGLPARSAEEDLVINVVPPPQPESAPAFDEASQAVLTGLVQSRGEWRAWINLRTQGKVLMPRVGDSFEIGSLKGTVVQINERSVELEIDGERFTLRLNGNLAEAMQQSSDVH